MAPNGEGRRDSQPWSEEAERAEQEELDRMLDRELAREAAAGLGTDTVFREV
jgi:hypothetical protein